jgi:hypothetical protein
MPSWRVSYRLAFEKEKTILQGWGIIDNKLDEDLKDIGLSLVAGKPISFIYDIYMPRIVPRPVVREEVRTVSAPVELEGGMEQLAKADMLLDGVYEEEADYDMAPCEAMAPAARAAPMKASKKKMRDKDVGVLSALGGASAGEFQQSVDVQTKTVEMGEFFKYDIANPVTVKRGQSAMVPILSNEITCKKEHVYNNLKMPRNPVVTMRIKNDSGAVLERGPILVLDEGTYVGEAILPYTSLQGENHIAYSVDLGVTVTEEWNHHSELKAISIKNRYFQKEYTDYRDCEYTIDNKKTEGIHLVIEHPKSEYEIHPDTPKATEETENYFRWASEIKPKTSTKFQVKEVKTRYYHEEIRYLGVETIESYLKEKYIEKRDYNDVKEIIDLQKEINDLSNKINDLENERNRIYDEQRRLRDNIQALGSSHREEKLRTKYIDKMDAQEARLEKIDSENKSKRSRIEELEKKIDDKLESFEK